MSSRTDPPTPGLWTAWFGLTLLVAVALRAAGLQSGLWYDEIVTLVVSARHPVVRILTEYPDVNVHPLYSLLAHVSMAAFGESAWALRLPAALFGVLSVALVYLLGAGMMARTEAWAGAAVLATSYHHIWFSQNARGYTLMGCLTLLSTHMLLRASQTGRRRDYIVYAVACAAGVYTHLTMAFVVGGQAAVVLGGRAWRWRAAERMPVAPLLWAWTGAGMLSAAAYAPYARALVANMSAAAPREAAKVATAGWAAGEAVRALLSGAGAPAVLIGGALVAVGAVSLWRRQPLVFALLVAPGLMTAAAIVGLGQPVRPRFFFFLSGAAALCVGRGIGAVVDAWPVVRPASRVAGIAACTMAFITVSAAALPRNYRLPKQDFDGAVRLLETMESQGARIAAAGPACLPFERYYGKTWACLKTAADWGAMRNASPAVPVVVAYTLPDYIADLPLRDGLRADCRVVQRFEGTLGGGDIVVCETPR